MTVVRNADGKWMVTMGTAEIAGPFDTMAQGWRWIDMNEGSPLNRGQAVANWRFEQEAAR